MSERTLQTLLDGGAFFEGPRWHDGRWWVSDFYRHRVITVDPDGREEEVMQRRGPAVGAGLDAGRLAARGLDARPPDPAAGGRRHGHRARRRQRASAAATSTTWSSTPHGPRLRRQLRLRPRRLRATRVPAALIRVDPDGTASVAAEDMLFPNGSVITPDGRTLIVGETAGARYTAFTIEADGSLGDRRVWAQVAPTPAITTLEETLGKLAFGPDGCALDAEGHIWSADEVGARCARVAPGGEIVDEIAMPEGLDVFACMLGGEDGRTLLMCAAPDFYAEARSAAHEAVLLTTTVDVPHAGLPVTAA